MGLSLGLTVSSNATRHIDSDDRLCVWVREAIFWIAFRALRPPPIGPRQLSDLQEDGDPDVLLIIEGRLLLAQQLLQNFAARGKIRIFSRYLESDSGEEFTPIQIPTEFIERATLESEDGIMRYSFVLNTTRYSNLAVDYQDLTEAFWGAAASPPATQAELNERPALTPKGEFSSCPPSDRRSRSARRRGRPDGYPWGDFNAELVRRCLLGPVRSQGVLEDHMLQWCTNQWGDEPAVSVIRERVSATFKMLEGLKLEADGLRLAEAAGNSAE